MLVIRRYQGRRLVRNRLLRLLWKMGLLLLIRSSWLSGIFSRRELIKRIPKIRLVIRGREGDHQGMIGREILRLMLSEIFIFFIFFF